MIFNDEVLFIHVPKTAGMSVTNYLAEGLRGEICNVAPSSPKKGPAAEMKHVVGPRHANLPKAQQFLATQNRAVSDFKVVLSVVRCPYDLEVSRFHYLQLGHPWDKGRAQEIALRGDFKEFCRSGPLQGNNPARIEEFYTLDGRLLPSSRIVRFENLNAGLEFALNGYASGAPALPKINVTKRKPYSEYYDAESEQAVYVKYQWLFDMGFYSRERF